MIKKIVKNESFIFVFSRYLTFFLKIFQGILIAKIFGPYLFGIWGFFGILQRYLLFSNFSIPNATMIKLSTLDIANGYKKGMIENSAFSFIIFLFFILLIFGFMIQWYEIPIFEKYMFNKYALLIFLIVALDHVNQLYVNLIRVYSKTLLIIVGEQLYAFSPFIAIFFYKDDALLMALIISLIVARVISIIIYKRYSPFSLKFRLNIPILMSIFSVSIPLLLKNLSFVLIPLSAYSVVSVYFTVEQLGYYSLSYSVSSSALLGVSTIAWLVYPKLLSKLSSSKTNKQIIKNVKKVDKIYRLMGFTIIFSSIAIMPLIFIFIDEFVHAEQALGVLLLSQGVLLSSFGVDSMMNSTGRQKIMAKSSFIAFVFSILLSIVVSHLGFDIVWVASSVLVASFSYTYRQSVFGYFVLNSNKGKKHLNDFFQFRELFPVFFCFFMITVYDNSAVGGFLSMLLYIILNKKIFAALYRYFCLKFRGL